MSSELHVVDEGENIFKAEGDIIVRISSVLTFTNINFWSSGCYQKNSEQIDAINLLPKL